jgi:hypothetical protein
MASISTVIGPLKLGGNQAQKARADGINTQQSGLGVFFHIAHDFHQRLGTSLQIFSGNTGRVQFNTFLPIVL